MATRIPATTQPVRTFNQPDRIPFQNSEIQRDPIWPVWPARRPLPIRIPLTNLDLPSGRAPGFGEFEVNGVEIT